MLKSITKNYQIIITIILAMIIFLHGSIIFAIFNNPIDFEGLSLSLSTNIPYFTILVSPILEEIMFRFAIARRDSTKYRFMTILAILYACLLNVAISKSPTFLNFIFSLDSLLEKVVITMVLLICPIILSFITYKILSSKELWENKINHYMNKLGFVNFSLITIFAFIAAHYNVLIANPISIIFYTLVSILLTVTAYKSGIIQSIFLHIYINSIAMSTVFIL
jgi:hypothetical protein